jgi:hypothetical protein
MARRGLAVLLFPLLLLVTVVLGLPRVARADQPGAHTVPVAVLAFDSEDAEEQADGITGAVRSRVRAAPGWSIIDTTQSLGMLTAAMKCPSRPPPECQQKIAEQIRTERYIWGFVVKGPTAGQVTAEIHLYQKGKPDTVLKESYADNLKDAQDDTLRKIATRIVERLGGTAVGVIVVRSSDQTGEVIVDGDKHVPLASGTARIELAAGGHSVEVAPTVGSPVKRNVLVTAGRETVVEFSNAATTEPPSETAKKQTRKIIGGISMGVGAVLAAISVIEVIQWSGLQSDGEERAKQIPKGQVCREAEPQGQCGQIDRDSKTASGLAWGFGAGAAVALGFGAVMFFTDIGSSQSSTAAASAPPKPKARVVPTVGAGSGGLVVVGTF